VILLRQYRESFTLPKEEPKKDWDITWDYNGYERAKDGPYGGTFTRKDWNQTIISKINELSAIIHKKTLRGGGNVLECGTNLEYIFNDIKYYDAEEQMVGARYKVVFKEELQSTIRVYNDEAPHLIMVVRTLNVPELYYVDKGRRLLLLK